MPPLLASDTATRVLRVTSGLQTGETPANQKATKNFPKVVAKRYQIMLANIAVRLNRVFFALEVGSTERVLCQSAVQLVRLSPLTEKLSGFNVQGLCVGTDTR